MKFVRCLLVVTHACGVLAPLRADDLDREPINYKKAKPNNIVADLQRRLDDGKAKLKQTEDHGYLRSVLRELDVPLSSQVLVFSKTSFQRERITPKTPRALYFNDEVYVGFCLRGDVLEFSAADSQLGTAFYTLDQDPNEPVKFTRQTDNCLNCHGSARTGGLPGHVVRSVIPDRYGMPILSAGSSQIDHTSPIEKRWGGWYVTGKHGKQEHFGNWIAQNKRDPETEDRSANQNLVDLKPRFTVANYLTPHSDLVALMVLEHQAEMHNKIVRASIVTRQALHYQENLNRELGEKPDHVWESVPRRIQAACEDLVRYLLFSEEAKLTERMAGTSEFAKEFAARGPYDKQGRSLRQFNLKTRLFEFPCSYLIYSKSFDGLPKEAKEVIYRRLHEVLSGQDDSEAFSHLSKADRTAIRTILMETKAEFAAVAKK
jgi:hypothetical protein